MSRVRLDATCRQLAAELTAIPDLTAGGVLVAQIHIEGTNGAAITTSQVPAHSSVACGITTTGNRKLRGSLIALGRQTIPWA